VSNIVDENLHALLTIGDLAAAVGVRPATLREWERRHGFPVPERLPSGHRRYPPTTVTDVRSVVERQRSGLSLASAIAAVRAERTGDPAATSIFAAVAAASDRAPVRLSRRTMLAFSRAIEDACAAAGDSAVLVGCFQREPVYRSCESRWQELARGARVCVALADFAAPARSHAVVEVPIASGSPLHREWSVAVTTPRLAACLAGWEWPGSERFEALWSIDPTVVTAAIERALAVARAVVPHDLPSAVDPAHVPSSGDLGDAMRLLDRVVERLDH
jgi:DICT domain-containing protein